MAFVDIGGICLDDLGDVPSSDKRTMGVSQEDSSHSQDVVCDLHNSRSFIPLSLAYLV